MDAKLNRIPAAESGAFQHWPLPDMIAGHIVPAASESARRQPPEAEESAHGLTAAELEQISREAYAEGRQQGLEQGYSEGHAEGFEQGRSDGLAAARGEIDDAVARLEHLCGQLLQPIDDQRAAIETALSELSLQLARAVIGRDPVTEPTQVRAAVEQALNALPTGAEGIEVFLHPDDLELLSRSGRVDPDWRLTADDGLKTGDLRLRTRHSVVDFTRETRFQQLLLALLEDRPQPSANAGPTSPAGIPDREPPSIPRQDQRDAGTGIGPER